MVHGDSQDNLILTRALTQSVAEELRRILCSDVFKRSQSLSELLTRIVEWSVEGRESELKEFVLGSEVLGRGAGFNPKTDPIVRVQVARLRSKLEAYYASAEPSDVSIEIPKGAYVARFCVSKPHQPPSVETSDQSRGRASHWRRYWAVAALIVAIAGAAGLSSKAARQRSGVVSAIAVIPFTDLSQRHDHRYVSDGVSEQLIESVAHIPGVRVVSPGNSGGFRADNLDVSTIAKQLNVAYVLTGSVQGEDRQIRVRVHLIRTSDGNYLWSKAYDSSLGDVFALEDMIANSVSDALEIQVAGSPQTRPRHKSVDAAAYELYLRGRFHWNERSEKGMREAATYFEQALRVDPAFAEAYAGLADVHSQLGEYGFDPLNESLVQAKDFAQHALRLNNKLSEAHATLGLISSMYDWQWSKAEEEFRLAVEENPGYASAHHWYGTMLYTLGRNDAATDELAKALASDPLSVPITTTLGWAYYNAKKPSLALEQASKALDLDPKYVPAVALDIYARLLRHDYPEALKSCQRVESLLGRGPRSEWYFGLVWAASGDRTKAKEVIQELSSMTQDPEFRPIYLATIFASLGESDSALNWINKSLAQHDPYLPFLRSDPLSGAIRADSRFAEVLQRMHM